jgi:hypothetical protein
MAKLMEHQESERPKYYRHFRRNRTAFYTDARGVVVDEATAKTNLVLTENLELSAKYQRVIQEAGERRREARQRSLNSAAIVEADRTARRIELLKGMGVNEKEAAIAARRRGGFLNPLCE